MLPLAVLRPGSHFDLEIFQAVALLDTGATASGIGPRLVEAMKLESYGKNRLGSATNEPFVDFYLFRIGLFADDQLAAEERLPGDLPFIFDEINGFHWPRPGDFDVILGMDVLSRCDLYIGRTGECRIRFGWA